MTDSQYHLSLPSFSDEEWEIFESDGTLFFAEALVEHIIDERDPAISTAPTTFSANCSNCIIASSSSARPAAGATISGSPTAPELLLQLKIGFWLTDLPEAKMVNLVVMPGSQRKQCVDEYDSHEPNNGDLLRKNIFYAYCPAWLTPTERGKAASAV